MKGDVVSQTLVKIRSLVAKGESMLSEHAYDRAAEDDIDIVTIESGAAQALPIEDYPDAHRGPSVLVLQMDRLGKPIHVVWGLRKDTTTPAVVITAYRPDPQLWTADFRSRR